MICKGIITDLVGQPIPKAIITIKSIRGATSITSSVYFHQCDDKGEYNFSLLKGKYKIWVQNSNFSDKNLVGVGVVESNTPDGDIDSILVAEDTPSPDEPITPSGCKCTWIKKTLTPTYFYITLDSTAERLTDNKVAEIIKNTDVTLITYEGFGAERLPIPKQYPLFYLGKTAEGYKYAFPYSLADTQDSYYEPVGHEKYILIQLHNRLSQYNTENSSFMHGLTKTIGTRIFRTSYGGSGGANIDGTIQYGYNRWRATNKIILSLAAEDLVIYSDLTSTERIPQDTAKVYYYKHIANEIEPVPMTFEFLENARQCTTEVEDKPEDTPDTPEDNTPEGVLTPYTLKAKFAYGSWYDYKFSAYCIDTQSWKEATKVVDDVVYYTFTEEEAITNSTWMFAIHEPSQEIGESSLVDNTEDIVITFEDTIMDDVVTIDKFNTTAITVGRAYV